MVASHRTNLPQSQLHGCQWRAPQNWHHSVRSGRRTPHSSHVGGRGRVRKDEDFTYLMAVRGTHSGAGRRRCAKWDYLSRQISSRTHSQGLCHSLHSLRQLSAANGTFARRRKAPLPRLSLETGISIKMRRKDVNDYQRLSLSVAVQTQNVGRMDWLER